METADERQPLLQESNSFPINQEIVEGFPDESDLHENAQDSDLHENAQDSGPKLEFQIIKKESKILMSLSWPVIGSFLLSYLNNMAPIITLGHLDTKYIAAISLASMTANITGFSIGYGLATALDTLCSQAFTGSTDKSSLGKHLQRGFVVMTVSCIPILFLWTYTREILVALGQDVEIARLSGIFMYYLMLGLWPQMIYTCLMRYLQAQTIMKASLIITMMSVPLNIFLQVMLVHGINGFGQIGPEGAPLATSLTYCFNCIIMILYTAYVEGYECWGGWDFKEMFDFRQIGLFLSLGLPGVVMLCSEWWCFEVVALLAGLLGDEYLAAQTIILNTTGLTYMIPMSLGIATSTRIGNSLGANLPFTSRNVAVSGYVLGFLFAGFNCVVLLSIKDVWGRVYSSDETVVKLVSQVIPLAALFQLNDGLGAVGSGVLRGCGRQKLGAYLNLSGYYLFGLPLGALFTFYFKMDLMGIWLGLTIALCWVSCIQVYLILVKTDWKDMAHRAVILTRSHSSTAVSDETETLL